MKTVTRGYSKIRSGLVLLALMYIATTPLFLFFVVPSVFSAAQHGMANVVLISTVFAVTSIASLACVTLILKKYKDSEEAVLLYQDGLWSNVSGISEKFAPWNRIHRAYVVNNSTFFPIVKVELEESDEERAQRSKLSLLLQATPTITIWPTMLEKNSINLADLINDLTLVHAFDNAEVEDTSTTFEEYEQKAA